MRAIRVDEPHRLNVIETDKPAPGPGEVLVRIGRAGICGSDMHIFHGLNPFARYPRVIGHEAMGQVVALGDGVAELEIDQRVVLDPVIACGRCHACKIGRPNVCGNLQVIGVHRDGGMSEFALMPRANAIPIPNNVSDLAAAMAEPYSVAANVMLRTGAGADDIALIYGAGVVGLTCLQALRMRGGRAIVVDIEDARLERASRLGADRVVNSRNEDLAAVVAAETGGYGVTVVIDGAGAPGLLEQAVQLAGPTGRIAVMNFAPGTSAIPQQEITKKELSLVGSRLNRRLIPEVLSWLASGAVKPEPLVTHEFRFDRALEAMHLIEQHPEATCKVHLTFD